LIFIEGDTYSAAAAAAASFCFLNIIAHAHPQLSPIGLGLEMSDELLRKRARRGLADGAALLMA
jgi:hypothetical protein